MKGVRGERVKAFHQFLAGDFGFWIIPSEKTSDGRSHPSGCLSLWNVQKKSVSNIVTSPLMMKTRFQSIGFHYGNGFCKRCSRLTHECVT